MERLGIGLESAGNLRNRYNTVGTRKMDQNHLHWGCPYSACLSGIFSVAGTHIDIHML